MSCCVRQSLPSQVTPSGQHKVGQQVPSPDQSRVKASDNYVGRILATIFSFGIYMFWWYYNQMDQPNAHFRGNWPAEDALVRAVEALGTRDPR